MKKEEIRDHLFEMQDLKYKEFHAKLIPTVNPDAIIGVRTPALRKFAKEFAKDPDAKEFLNDLPHKYYEENNLHAFVLETIKDYETCVSEVDKFLPYVDNWATCDMMSPKIFKKHLPKLLVKCKEWMKSDETYVIRFGVEMLMNHFLEEEFKEEYLALVAGVSSEEYYIKMMVAWYFATALAKQYEPTVKYIEAQKLDVWTHNKAIQKAVESYRITPKQKDYLRTLKRK